MILQKLNDKMPLIRRNIIFGIFILLIFITSFFSGEWNYWLQAFILVLTSLLLFYVIFLFGKSDHIFKSWPQKYFSNPNTYLVLFALIVLLTSFVSVNKYKSFSQLFLLFAYLAIYFSAYKYFRDWNKIRIILRVVYYCGALTATIALLMYVFQSASRANGLLFNANALGGYLIFSFLIGLIFLFNKYNSRRIKLLDIICLVIIFLALLLTYSYTSWVSLLIPVIIILVFFRQKVFTKKSLNWIIVIFLLIFVSLSFFRFQNSNNLSEAVKVYKNISTEHVSFSLKQRSNFDLAALDIFQDNIFTGTGYNTFQSVYGRYYYSVDEQPRYAHNYYLQTLSELGTFGLLFFVGFILLIIYRARQVYSQAEDEQKKLYYFAIFVGLLGTSIHSLFDFSWQFPAVFIVFWIFSGLINSQFQKRNLIERNELTIRKNNFSTIIIMSVGIIVALLIITRGITLLAGNYYYQSAGISANNGDLENQWSYLLKGYSVDPNPNKLVDYVQAKIKFPYLLDQEDYTDLENKMNSLIKINNEEYFAHWMLGRVYIAAKKYDLAIIELSEAIRSNPVFRPDFQYDLAFVYFEKGDYFSSKKTILSILEVYPEGQYSSNPNLPTQLSYLYLLLGRNYFEEGNIQKAREYYELSLSYIPNFNLALDQLKKLD